MLSQPPCSPYSGEYSGDCTCWSRSDIHVCLKVAIDTNFNENALHLCTIVLFCWAGQSGLQHKVLVLQAVCVSSSAHTSSPWLIQKLYSSVNRTSHAGLAVAYAHVAKQATDISVGLWQAGQKHTQQHGQNVGALQAV